jgi:hypothetical protein
MGRAAALSTSVQDHCRGRRAATAAIFGEHDFRARFLACFLGFAAI